MTPEYARAPICLFVEVSKFENFVILEISKSFRKKNQKFQKKQKLQNREIFKKVKKVKNFKNFRNFKKNRKTEISNFSSFGLSVGDRRPPSERSEAEGRWPKATSSPQEIEQHAHRACLIKKIQKIQKIQNF